MTSTRAYAAVDLGAGSGRVIVGRVLGVGGEQRIELEEVHRFGHDVRLHDGHLRWDFARILQGVERGLAAAARTAGDTLRSVGVDGWGVDHGFLDAGGRLLADPIAYRDARTEGVLARLLERVPRAELHARTGIQCMPINTSVQLLAQVEAGEWPREAATLLLVPDLVHHHLCGSRVSEVTNASTTQLLEARTRTWDRELCRRLGIPDAVLPPLVAAGTRLGTLHPALARRLGLAELPVVAPGTHDTASAVAGTPLEPGEAYLSSGTWSLVGLETPAPVLGARAAEDNVTNEAGVAGTNRLLKNVMGLWILEECRRSWSARGRPLAHADLERALVGRAPPPADLVARLDPDDERFLHPSDMPAELAAALRARGAEPPTDEVDLAALVLHALARRYAQVLARLAALTGSEPRALRVVGGGSRNAALNQATADATRLVVHAGPVEATALGNLVVQALQDGAIPSLGAARAAIARSTRGRRFAPERI